MKYLKLIRMNHWVKNFLIFIPIIFAGDIFDFLRFERVALAFVSFCLLASAVYIINDLFDKKADSLHPTKSLRPIASGKIGASQAIFFVILFTTIAFAVSFIFIPEIIVVLLAYLALNLLYSFYFKYLPIFDILFIAGFYLIRILIGGLAGSVLISSWLVLCIVFASLLIIIGKRLGELKHENKREVLKFYNEEFLKQLLYLFAGLSIVSYGLYSALAVNSPLAVYSVFFVILGVIRYLYVSQGSDDIEYPEKMIINDRVILFSIILWLIYMFFCVINV